MPATPAPILKLSDLRKLAALARDALQLEVGLMALVQRPPQALLEQAALALQGAVTVPVAKPKVASHALSLMMGFGDMLVVPLGARVPEGSWTMGRSDDCDVRVSDPSTSLRHAEVRWDAWMRSTWISDLGSTNGTFVNGQRVRSEQPLNEGDTLSLGDAAFLFVHVETLHAMLRSR